MTVTIVRFEGDLPPCGRCDAPLPAEPPVKLYLFDRFDEIDHIIKTGNINLAVCPSCDYRGWLWLGLLVVDRGRRRGVFVGNLSLPREHQLEELLLTASAHMDAATLTAVTDNTLWIHDYERLFESLCKDDQLFHLEALSDEASRRRTRITDMDARALQFIEDGLRAGGMVSFGPDEATARFLDALTAAIANLAAAPGLPRKTAEFLLSLQIHIEDSRENLPEPEASPPESRMRGYALDDFTEAERQKALSMSATEELNAGLAELVVQAASVLKRDEFPDEQVSREFGSLLRSLIELTDSSTADMASLVEEVAAGAPPVSIGFEDRHYSTADAVRAGAAGQNVLLIGVASVAFGLPFGFYLDFWLEFTRLLTKLQATSDRDVLVPRFLALTSCGHYFLERGSARYAAAAYAGAVLTLQPPRHRALRFPQAAAPLVATVWKRLGRLLNDMGDPSRAMACARTAARFFAMDHDLKGNIGARLDALDCASRLPNPGRAIAAGRDLLAEIRRLEGDHASDEVACLCFIGELYFRASNAPAGFLMELDSDAEKTASGPNRPAGVDLYDTLLHVISSADAGDGGSLLLARVAPENRVPYIVSLDLGRLDWFTYFAEAADLAARHELADRWFHIQSQIVERSRHLVNAEQIPLHLYESMLRRARELGFGDPPEYCVNALLPTLAAALTGSSDTEKQAFLASSAVTRALDTWSASLRSPTPHDMENGGEAPPSPFAGIMFGEFFEAVGRYSEAQDAFLLSVSQLEDRLLAAVDSAHEAEIAENRFTGLYRAARAGLKEFLRNPKDSILRQCLDTIECYKARGILREPLARVEATRVSRFHRLTIDQLRSALPPATAVLVFSLLPSTNLNDGFWFSALIDPSRDEISCPRCVPFDQYYAAHVQAGEALAELRSRITGSTLDQASADALRAAPTIDHALERLGSALVPADVIARLVSGGITNLVIIPEAYLLDVPWPAIRVRMPGASGALPLFKVNEQLGGLAITIAPNWTVFADLEKRRNSAGDGVELAVAVSDRPAWRSAMRLFGAARQVRRALESALASAQFGGRITLRVEERPTTVSDFLRNLRNSSVAVFFGHGEILPESGSVLVAHDGPVGELEIVAGSQAGRFSCMLAILCACSGVDSAMTQRLRRRDLAGAHVAMVRGGVGFIVGSVEPLFPIVAFHLLENIMRQVARGGKFADALRECYASLDADPKISSPVFWGHIVGFGNGFQRLRGVEIVDG